MGLIVACMASYRAKDSGEVDLEAYKADTFMEAIKGLTINRRSHCASFYGHGHPFHDGNRHLALDWFVNTAHDFMESTRFGAEGPGPYVLIPLPGSKLVQGATAGLYSPQTLATKLAARLNTVGTTTHVADVLRWDQPMRNTYDEGGSQDPEELYPHLVVTGSVPAGRLFLLDDVCAEGGHMRAAAYVLKRCGVEVRYGLCALKAENAPGPQHPYFEPSVHYYPNLFPREARNPVLVPDVDS